MSSPIPPGETDGFHARDLIELAALLAANGPSIMSGAGRIPGASMEQYWSASKSRLDRWGRAIKRYRDEADRLDAFVLGQRWVAKRPMFEELFTSEALTRVWGAVIAGYDHARGQEQYEPLVCSVMHGHAELRNRAMTFLATGSGVAAQDAVALNRLRRRVERWTDLLVARLMQVADVGEYAADVHRANDFSRDFREQAASASGRHAWALAVASLRAAFSFGLAPVSPNADLNERIAQSVTASFSSDLFDATGTFRSLWLVRMTHNTQDAQGLIDEFLATESRPSVPNGNRLAPRIDERG